MSPRALDPLYRAREFPRMPSPRRQSRSLDQRLHRVEQAARTALDLGTQPASQATQGTIFTLPTATLDDINKLITVHSTGGLGTQTYIGVLDPFGVPQWLLITSNDSGGSGSGTIIGSSTFTADTAWVTPITGPRRLAATSDGSLFLGFDNQDIRLLVPGTGTFSTPVAGFPPTATTIRGVSSRTTATGDIYVDGRSAKKLYRWNSSTSTIVTSPDTQTFQAVRYSAVAAAVFAVYGTSGSAGAIARYAQSTLAFVSNVRTWVSGGAEVPSALGIEPVSGDLLYTTTISGAVRIYRMTTAGVFTWGSGVSRPEVVAVGGVDCDSTFVYVADSSGNKIHLYLLTNGNYQGSIGASGTGVDQLSSPQDVAVSGSNIYIADYGNNRITRWVKS